MITRHVFRWHARLGCRRSQRRGRRIRGRVWSRRARRVSIRRPHRPLNTSLVGVWTFDPNISDPSAVVVFTADGVYYEIEEGQGFERGLYTFDGSNVSFTTLLDTNGSAGFSDDERFDLSSRRPHRGRAAGRRRRRLCVALPRCGRHHRRRLGRRQPHSARQLIRGGLPRQRNGSRYFTANDYPEFGLTESRQAPTRGIPSPTSWTSRRSGVRPMSGNFVTPAPDGLSLHVLGDDGEEFDVTRVIDPATIPVITNAPLSASGTVGQAFSYDVDATNTSTFSATGLPDGLSINSSTGVDQRHASGRRTVRRHGHGHQRDRRFGHRNADADDRDTDPVGQNVVVEPEVPEGQGPVTLTFGEITSAGETTVTVVDLDQSEVPAPGNVAVAGVVYEVTTTATYQGLITLCFSYAGIDFGEATPRLFHYENNAWVDITTSVDPAHDRRSAAPPRHCRPLPSSCRTSSAPGSTRR